MLWTDFSPGLDGSTDWAFTQPEGLYSRQLERIFRDACASLLEGLHRPYFNAVETYNLPQHTGRWIDNAPLKICAQEAGKIYVILDHFSASLPLPRHIQALGRWKESIFYQYFCQRSLDNIQSNTTGLLQALAISSLIPDEWFPKKELERLIETRIRRLGLYRNVKADCQLSLEPGGPLWLSRVTIQAVEKIREKLASDQPWPVRMLRSPGRLSTNRQAIVYACQEGSAGRLRLEIFEPDCVLDEHALQIGIDGEQVDVVEIAPPEHPLPVLGLLCEAYSPALPPLECSPWWSRSDALRQVWRQLGRLRRG